MAKKIVNTKIEIPKWYTKRIKNFETLTENEALFEYESLKLRERYRKTAKKLKKEGYIVEKVAPKIVRPSAVIQSDIDYLKRIEIETIKEAVKYSEPIVKYDAPIYDYEPTVWKEENLPDFRYDERIYFDDYGDSEDDYLTDYDIKQIESSFPEPEPTPPLFVDLSTGQAIYEEDIPDYLERVKEFIDDIIDEAYNQGDQAVVSHSTYRSGRTKTSRSRAWVEQNIDRAVNKVVSKLMEIRNTDSLLQAFAKKCNDSSYLSSLQNAIGAYIAEAYSDTTGQSFYISKAYELLSFAPTTLDDAMDFEYEE